MASTDNSGSFMLAIAFAVVWAIISFTVVPQTFPNDVDEYSPFYFLLIAWANLPGITAILGTFVNYLLDDADAMEERELQRTRTHWLRKEEELRARVDAIKQQQHFNEANRMEQQQREEQELKRREAEMRAAEMKTQRSKQQTDSMLEEHRITLTELGMSDEQIEAELNKLRADMESDT